MKPFTLLILLLCSLFAAAQQAKPPVLRQLEPLSIRGVNYFPRQTPWSGMWTKTPREVFQADMKLAASLNINTIRTFLQFSPALEKADLISPDGVPTKQYFERIEQLLDAAWSQQIRIIFCFEFSREWLEEKEHPRWPIAMTSILHAYKDDGRVLLWDVMNEPDDNAKWTPATQAYLRDALPLVRKLDPNHLTTIGLAWRIDRIAPLGLPDLLQYHEYCPKDLLFKQGTQRVSISIANQRKGGNNAPLLIGEFGMSTARDPDHGADPRLRDKLSSAPGTEEEQARLYKIILEAAQKDRVIGVMAWCLHDYPIQNPNESHFGLIRSDDTLKPAAKLLRDTFADWNRNAAQH